MTYFLYGLTLAFGWYVCVNVTLAAAVLWLAPRVVERTRSVHAHTRAALLLALRLAPSAGAIAFTLCVFVPSFLRYEPRDFDEAFGVTTTSLAVLACAAIATAAWRGATALRDVGRRTKAWMHGATPLDLASVQPAVAVLPAFSVPSPVPAMTLVGVVRPKLLVTARLLDALSREELAAAIAHERSHHESRDNLKRLAMRSAPDVLSRSRGMRTLEEEWSVAAEHAADARAARDPERRVALASALIKAARIAVERPAPLASLLVGGDSLRSRVERLLDHPEAGNATRTVALGRGVLAIAAALALTAYPAALSDVHRITEAVVHYLP